MTSDKLIINVTYSQPVEIVIEFPLNVLYAYNGADNLDVTWDDNIMYAIHNSLTEAGVQISKTELTEANGALSWHLLLIAVPPLLDLNCIVERLTKEGFEKGLHIHRKINTQSIDTLYP